jgi:hypothetical protein
MFILFSNLGYRIQVHVLAQELEVAEFGELSARVLAILPIRFLDNL